jgi:hypothetical protein
MVLLIGGELWLVELCSRSYRGARQAYCDSSRCLKCERDDALKVAYKTGEEADFCLNYYGNDRSWDDHGKEATRKEFDWDFMS